MSLPTMQPTGAMASGDYVDYMISYLNTAMEEEMDQLDQYLSNQVFEAWSAQWTRQITELSADVVALSTRVNKLRAQASMARDAINRA